MKGLLVALCAWLTKTVMSLRYKVTIKGLDEVSKNALHPEKGFLFLPNHPTILVDPTLITLALLKEFRARPVIIDTIYYTTFVHFLMRLIHAVPIPSFTSSTNTHKVKRGDHAIYTVINGLKSGESFLFYPAGRIKTSSLEHLGANSGLNQILNRVPDANVVFVRIKGLWGSSFSRAFQNRSPDMKETAWNGIKHVLKNFIFFTPRRSIEIEFVPAPEDFPVHASKLVQNSYLENWYNLPDGLNKENPDAKGDTLVLTPISVWSKANSIEEKKRDEEEKIEAPSATILKNVKEATRQKIYSKIAELADVEYTSITPQMRLDKDLGLDSLDGADITAYLEEEFNLEEVSIEDLPTVGHLLAVASDPSNTLLNEEEEKVDKKWDYHPKAVNRKFTAKETLVDTFMAVAEKYASHPASADGKAGVLSFRSIKMRALLLAKKIEKMPGKHIGILLPAAVATQVLILACQIAGKIPVMVNWTTGSRQIKEVVRATHMQVAISSWAFLDKLSGVDLSGIDNILCLLEDLRDEFTFKDKVSAAIASYIPFSWQKKCYPVPKSREDVAVVLFTSGSEGVPKGVPLTHNNILSNLEGMLDIMSLLSTDVLFSFLPPFHSFGFTVGCFAALLSGARTFFFPNPTDGKSIARDLVDWEATLVCGAPAFLKNILRYLSPEAPLKLRYMVTGAEKAPQDLFDSFHMLDTNAELLEGYGITECSPVLTLNHPGLPPGGVGKPLFNVDIQIAHPESFEILSQGETGMILASGPSIFKGYLNASSNPFMEIEGKFFYKTGDLGFLDKEGRLIITGRLKRFIKIGAEMVSLGAVEEVLKKEVPAYFQKEGPAIAVIGKEIAGEKPKIFVFSTFAFPLDQVNEALKKAGFSNLVRASVVIEVPEIPLMGTGKVHYRALEEEFIQG